MGLSRESVGIHSVDKGLVIRKNHEDDKVIALAGNPNVGKSTVFNQLTGMRQHTGNWPGKTVANAQGYCSYEGKDYVMVDIPGCYSLMAHSTEEEVARDFICFENPDAVVVVCDATCLERNLKLVLQILECTKRVVVCVNLMDEAKKKGISINLAGLEKELSVPVIGVTARSNQGLEQIFTSLGQVLYLNEDDQIRVPYPAYIEAQISLLKPRVSELCPPEINSRWLSARLLEVNENLMEAIKGYLGFDILEDEPIRDILKIITGNMEAGNISSKQLNDDIVSAYVKKAEAVCRNNITFPGEAYNGRDRRLDQLFTSKLTGFPIMFLILLGIFWFTIIGADYPSEILSSLLLGFEDHLFTFMAGIGIPIILCEVLVTGVYRVLAWVVAVMLPPMAIFFPLFTILEDFGYLPRVAFNLDRCFKRCCACGKQALTMCMGFGCNAAGIIGCRIIDSPRERLIAMITNNFVPCNGRFPILIAIISMFFVSTQGGLASSLLSALLLSGIIMLGILMTFLISKVLSGTILKGVPSSFTLELPPYRRPQIGKVIVRSICDRTLFVLGRAIVVAAPAGLVIWIMANVTVGDFTILAHMAGFLDPFGRLIGLDGVILLAFILGLPANEIVIPIMLMAYMSQGALVDVEDYNVIRGLLVENGWTWVTAVSTMLFALMHWPCSTTCLTIRKETGSWKWTAVSFLVPTVTGIIICFLFTSAARLFL